MRSLTFPKLLGAILGVVVGVSSTSGCSSNESDATGGGGTNGGEGGGTASGTCERCDNLDEDTWCLATSKCSPRDGSECPYGLVENKVTCDDPQAGLPTNLPIDCRHQKNEGDPRCEGDISTLEGNLGSGLDLTEYQLGDGFVDAGKNRLVIPFNCLLCNDDDSGIIAIDLDSGDRTLLSGHYADPLQGPKEAGAGPQPTSFDAVKVGLDGKWIALDNITSGAEIYEVDPTTGDRTVLYPQEVLEGGDASDANGTGICKAGPYTLQVAANVSTSESTGGATNFVIAADGTIYARAERSGTSRETLNLEALVALKGGACTVLALSSTFKPELAVGQGPPIQVNINWIVDDGDRLLVPETSFTYQAIDKATGNRSTVSSALPGNMLGAGPELGDSFALLSPDGATLHTVGYEAGTGITDVDLASGDRTLFARQTRSSEFVVSTLGPIFAYPKLADVFLVAPEGGVMLFEPKTGNYMNFSH